MEIPTATRSGRNATWQSRFRHWLDLGEDVILIGVAIILLIAGFLVLIGTGRALVSAVTAQSFAEALFYIVENALLALILAELVHTLLVSLGGGALSPEPFIVIGIVGVMRKVLLTTAVTPKASDGEAMLSAHTAELLALGALILMLGITLAIARHFRPQVAETPSGLIVPPGAE